MQKSPPSSQEPKKNLRIALYLRVSTGEQVTEGYGLETQERLLKALIESNADRGWITNNELIYREE
jgi:DNA invertase Pin-like site-specific DNA recombinase